MAGDAPRNRGRVPQTRRWRYVFAEEVASHRRGSRGQGPLVRGRVRVVDGRRRGGNFGYCRETGGLAAATAAFLGFNGSLHTVRDGVLEIRVWRPSALIS